MSGSGGDEDQPGRAGDLRWQFRTGAWVRSSPTVVDGAVHVGSNDGNLYKLDAETGARREVFETGGMLSSTAGLLSSPLVADGTVYVGSNDSRLYALDAETYEKEWHFYTGSMLSSMSGIFSSPTVAEGTVLFGRDSLYAVDAEAGTQQWRFTTDGGVRSSPTVVGGTVYVGSKDNRVYALDADDGNERWRFRTGSAVNSSPTVAGGTVYVGSRDDNVYALDAHRGVEHWRFDAGGDVFSSPTVTNGQVVFGTFAGDVYALDAKTGDQQWRVSTGDSVKSSATVLDDTVFIGSFDGAMYALDLETGEERWHFDTGRGVFSSPTVVDGMVVFGSDDGHVYALDAGVRGSSEDSRVRLRTLGHHEDSGYVADISSPSLAVSLLGTNAPVEVGRELTLRVEVTNLATVDGAESVRAEVEGLGSTTTEQTLASGESELLSMAIPTAGAASGTHTLTVSTDHDSVTSAALVVDSSGKSDGAGSSAKPIPEQVPTLPEVSVTYSELTTDKLVASSPVTDVYRATVKTTDGEVVLALKEPQEPDSLHPGVVDRLLSGFEIWDLIDEHDHVVSLAGYGGEPHPWVATEHLDGGNLGWRAGQLDFEQALWTAVATTEAVEHAHSRGVAHLELTPGNVLFRSVEGAWDVPKVSGWGFSTRLLASSTTSEGLSPQYTAPEQVDPDTHGHPDNVTDVYQLGILFYELFTGRSPFDEAQFEDSDPVPRGDPDPPSDVAVVPSSLDDVLLTAMAAEKSDRYGHVSFLGDDLQALFERF